MNKYIKKIINLIPLKNIILFESRPDLSDNTKAVFDEMLRRGYNKKYKLVWMLSDGKDAPEELTNILNVKFIKRVNKNKFERLLFQYYLSSAKLIIGCNDFLPKPNSKQKYIHLAHGCALKKTEYYHLPNQVDYVLTISDYMKKYDAINYNCSEDKLIVTGYPRCDDLFIKENIRQYFDRKYKKTILWLPTYRQSDRNGGCFHSSLSFPIIDSAEKANELNELCKKMNILIIVKVHPNQDMSLINSLSLSHLKFITDKFFSVNSTTLYRFMGNCDALLSDYSSVYYDFLLCNKPIGLCWDDFEEYNNRVGFTVDPNFIMQGGEKIYNLDDLLKFITDVYNGKDELSDKRKELLTLVHRYTDEASTDRAVDFIEKYL